MRLAVVIALLAWVGPVRAQDRLRVLEPAKDGVEPHKMLYSYLLTQAGRHFEARRQAVAAIKTPADLVRRQRELKARFLEALGGFPPKTPLGDRVVGRLRGDGFHVEKVVYESRPGHRVTANLYLPDGKGPFPGVLVPCGHSANGKAAEAYQRVCILMARNGLAALCYDPIGQGERGQILDEHGQPALAGSTLEHTMVGVGALLVGRCAATYHVWDGIRGLDYLAARPEIDPRRLGCTGNSGGGTLTAYLMALDDRVAAAAPSCYITSLERLFATIGPQDAEQNIPGQVAFGMDHADYLTMRAPRPTLVCLASRDFFDIGGSWASFREAAPLYGLLGHGERIAAFEYGDTHGFSKPRREAALRWMRRWLLRIDDAPAEGEFPVFTDRDLQCTRTGQVLTEYHGRSVIDFNAERARELAARRGQVRGGPSQPETVAEIRRRLGLAAQVTPAKVIQKGESQGASYTLRKVVFVTEPGILVPGLHFVPQAPRPGEPLVLYVDGEGMATSARPSGPIEALVRAGKPVLAVDLRGLGETSPAGASAGFSKHFGPDYREAFLAMHVGRPLLGQRVHDLLAILPRIDAHGREGVRVIGVGAAAPVVLHAAALDRRIRHVTLERMVVSWSAVAAARVSRDQLSSAVPGALEVYDLPELAGLLAPRPLTVRAAAGPAGEAISQGAVERAYAPCREAYSRGHAAGNLHIEAGRPSAPSSAP
jgi:cephalosporin-C deacetylase-like acetyl esterase